METNWQIYFSGLVILAVIGLILGLHNAPWWAAIPILGVLSFVLCKVSGAI